ncbi:MAG: ATP-binding protein, partial [Carnobacterium sp.]
MIQLLVENAIRHAFEGRKIDNRVSVSVYAVEKNLTVSVSDNGFGIKADRLSKLGREIVPSEKGTGSALENLNKRLVSLFGKSA